jgi:hypothetical protein
VIDRNLFDWAPLVVIVATLAFVADWLLTLAGVKAYARVRDRCEVEGSYEMNPAWVAAVENGRWVTPRVVLSAALIVALMGAIWLLGKTARYGVTVLSSGACRTPDEPIAMTPASAAF